MPTDLNIVVLKASDANNDNTTDRYTRQLQFTREFTVRKDVVLKQLYFLKAHYPRYRDVQIDNDVDLLHYSNVIDHITNSKYRDASPSRGSISNQRPRTQLEANPTNSAEADDNDNNNDSFDSSAILALDIDCDINNLYRYVGARRQPLSRQQPRQRPALTQPNVEERPLSEQIESQAILLLAFLSLYPRGLAEIN